MVAFRRYRKSGRRPASALLALLLLAPTLVLLQAAPASAEVFPPRYVRSIAGMGRPGVFAWGVQWNPVSNEVLVGDYLHFKVRRYDLAGNHLGDFWRPGHLGQPYTIAVDHNDGAIYVAELKDNPFAAGIAKYDKAGNFLYAIPATLGTASTTRFRAFYPVWMTVEEDTGDIFVLDSHYTHTETNPPRVLQLRFDDATKTVTQVNAWPVLPPDMPVPCEAASGSCVPRLYGIDITTSADPLVDDTIYLSDSWNARGYRYTKSGVYLDSFGQTQTGGGNRSVVANEAIDRVYLVDAQHSDVDMFTLGGNYVGSFANEGDDAGEFAGGGRQMDIDGEGNLWVADYGGFETEKFTPTGGALLRAPQPPRKPPVGMLGQPRDVAVDDPTGEVWVADAWNQRFSQFSSTGTHIGTWGERGDGGPFDMNYPRSIAIQPRANGGKRIWVANERGHHFQVYNYPSSPGGAPTYVRQVGLITSDDTDPGHFRWPVDVEFYNRPDGVQVAVMGDRMASSVKIFNAETFEELLMIPDFAHGTAVDPATGNIYTMNSSSDIIEIYSQAGVKLGQFGSRGNGNGQFQDAVDGVFSNGILYVADERLSRVQAFQPSLNTDGTLGATYLGRWGSTFGSNVYDFKGAVGIDADGQGRIYVTDTGNDRIQVFNPNLGRQFESVLPSAPVVTAPPQQSTLPQLAPVTLTGTATDNVSVGNVELAIQDHTTGQWWNAGNQSWEATKTQAIAAWSGTGGTSVNWRYVFLGVSAQGRYVAEVRTRDHNANISSVVVQTFAMPGATAPPPPVVPTPDSTRPDGTQTSPTANQVLPLAPVNFAGGATDNVGVTSVRIAIKRVSDGRWLNTSGGFSTTFTWHETTLASPGAPSTNWSWTWSNPPSAGGSFQTLVEARDAAGNVDGTKPQVPFSTTNQPPDTVAPETALTAPADASSFESGPVSITGDASDDKVVASVKLGIQNTANSLWWTGTGWSAAAVTVDSVLSAPGTTATGWSYSFNPGVASTFAVTATARDADGNADASPATTSFSITTAPPDTVAPDTTITVPTFNQVFPNGPITFSGQATDNVSVQRVRISIRNRTTLQYWNGTSWQNSFVWLNGAVLSDPGAPVTGWTFSWTPPPGAEIYNMAAGAVDGANILDPTRPSRNFSVNG